MIIYIAVGFIIAVVAGWLFRAAIRKISGMNLDEEEDEK